MVHPTITAGSRNHAAVHDLQVLLTRKGFRCDPDGWFGPGTVAQVRRFQARVGLQVDAVVGPKTWTALVSGKGPQPLPSPTPHHNPLSSYLMADCAKEWATAGHPYVFGGKAVPLSIPHPAGLDCSGLVEWAVFHATGEHWCAGSVYQAAAVRRVNVAQAIRTKGALLFETDNGMVSGVHHVAVSLGNGQTAEARSALSTPNCGSFHAAGRFNLAGEVPTLRY